MHVVDIFDCNIFCNSTLKKEEKKVDNCVAFGAKHIALYVDNNEKDGKSVKELLVEI